MGSGGSRRKLPSVPSLVGEDHFEKGKQVGEGGFGKVNAIQHYAHAQKKHSDPKHANGWYAMKTLSKKTIKESNNIVMIFNERNLLSRLPPNRFICNMHYAFQDDDNCFIVMDLAIGGDLRYHLNHKHETFPGNWPNAVQFYALCLVLSMEFVHSQGIIHRDIKPDNVVIGRNGYAMLTDFGISKLMDEDGNCTGTSGTGRYKAPEIDTMPMHNAKVDVYALGKTVQELLSSGGSTDSSRPGALGFIDKCLHSNAEERASISDLLGSDGGEPDEYLLDLAAGAPWRSFLQSFREHTFPAPFIPSESISYFEMSSQDLMMGLDGSIATKAKKKRANTDPAFAAYDYNVNVDLQEGTCPCSVCSHQPPCIVVKNGG